MPWPKQIHPEEIAARRIEGIVSRFVVYPGRGTVFAVVLAGDQRIYSGVAREELADVHFTKPGDAVEFLLVDEKRIRGQSFINVSFRSEAERRDPAAGVPPVSQGLHSNDSAPMMIRKVLLRKMSFVLFATSGAAGILGLRATRAILFTSPLVIWLALSQAPISGLAVAVFFAIAWKLAGPETWSQRVYNLLAAFEPVALDRPGLHALQMNIQADAASRSDLERWLRSERVAQPNHWNQAS